MKTLSKFVLIFTLFVTMLAQNSNAMFSEEDSDRFIEHAREALRQQFEIANAESNLPPLHTAVLEGDIELVGYFLSAKKMPVDSVDLIDRTPLYYAVRTMNKKIIQLLVHEYDADINASDMFGDTPYKLSQRMGFTNAFAK